VLNGGQCIDAWVHGLYGELAGKSLCEK